MDANFITNFGLEVLKSAGTRGPFVFSPVSILLSLAVYQLENTTDYNAGGLRSQIFNGATNPELRDFVWKYSKFGWKKGQMQHDFHWKYPVVEVIRQGFSPKNLHLKQQNFLAVSAETSRAIQAGEGGLRFSQDAVFQVLAIPFRDNSLSLVIFLPVRIFELHHALKALDMDRFQLLVNDRNTDLVHFEIPTFAIFSVPNISSFSAAQNPNIFMTSAIVISSHGVYSSSYYHTNALHNFRETRRLQRDWLYRLENTPVNFGAIRPFMFAVMNGSVPIQMGVLT